MGCTIKSSSGLNIKNVNLMHIVKYEYINGVVEEECVKKLQKYLINNNYNVSYDLKAKVMQWFDNFKIGKTTRPQTKVSKIIQKPIDLSSEKPIDLSSDEPMDLSEHVEPAAFFNKDGENYLHPVPTTSDAHMLSPDPSQNITQEILIKAEAELNKKHQIKNVDILAPQNFGVPNLSDDQLRDLSLNDFKDILERATFLTDLMKGCLKEKRRTLRNRKIAKDKNIEDDKYLTDLNVQISNITSENRAKNCRIKYKEDKITDMLKDIKKETGSELIFCSEDKKWKLIMLNGECT